MVKLIEILKRKDGMPLEEFSRYWREHHGPLAVQTLPGFKRYVQNHALWLPGSGEPRIDGVTELWFDDLESQRACAAWYNSEEGRALREDEARFTEIGKATFFVCEEVVIKE